MRIRIIADYEPEDPPDPTSKTGMSESDYEYLTGGLIDAGLENITITKEPGP